ncbi:hypothetical protein D9756_005588 [Leucocoprinus leucothites]|uniref:Uncharacterized protein n=1 Tax=Leucocoprinus leucothites TaxID=201217 RepID=A0A8H5D9N8_9AGAR|nr:hypothetical protein D9756_005588 [Leucoagaricus leucothites]
MGSPRQKSQRGPKDRPSQFGRELIKEEVVPPPRPRQPREVTNPSVAARRQSRLSIISNSLRFKKSGGMTAEKVVDRQRSMRDQREEQWQELLDEQHELMKRISNLNGKVERRSKTLRTLREQDDGEKWEDELFETRLKELNSARDVITTQSSVKGEDVRVQIKDLNEEIAKTAAIAAETSIGSQRQPGQLESMPYLGHNLSLIFRKAENRLDDRKLVQAILQIFLTECCMILIDSWHIENENLDAFLRGLYVRIRRKEEQTVAGKWRQITFSQVPHGESTNLLKRYSNQKAQQVMEISSAAGWGGDTSRVKRHVQKVMEAAEKIRENIKAGIISADLEPWIAVYTDLYDDLEMKDVGSDFALPQLENKHEEDYHVLGSTELGLRVHGTNDDQSNEFKNLRTRPRHETDTGAKSSQQQCYMRPPSFMSENPPVEPSGSRQRHQDMPVELHQGSFERSTPHQLHERWSQVARPRQPIEDLPEPKHLRGERQHSRRIQERCNRLTQSEPVSDPELEQLQDEISCLYQIENELMERQKKLEDDIEETQMRLKRRETQREDLKEITEELAVAQRFLSTADSLSQAEVVRAMEALNEEIFQLTSIAADKVQVKNQRLPSDGEMAKLRRQIPEWVLGPAFMDEVTLRKLDDALAIQIGWQAILAARCSRLIRSWHFDDENVNQNVYSMYKSIWAQNDQAVAGRWRSLTSGSTKGPSQKTWEREARFTIKQMVILPILCGYILDKKSHDELVEIFSQRIAPLLDKCLKFRRTVREGFTSMDIQPYYIESGEPHNPLRADLDYEDAKEDQSEKKGVVACSLSMGLYSIRISRVAEGKVSRRGVVLKPKVSSEFWYRTESVRRVYIMPTLSARDFGRQKLRPGLGINPHSFVSKPTAMFDFLKTNRPSKRDRPPEPYAQRDAPQKRMRPLSKVFTPNITNRFSKAFTSRERDRGPAPDPELEKLRSDVEQARTNERTLFENVKGLDTDIEKVQQRLNERVNRREELERVTKELAVAQRFLSTADSLSQAEVVRALEALNEEIFQLTSIIADKVQVTERHLQEGDRLDMFRSRVLSVGALGAFLEVVEPKHLEDSLGIQIGWQAMLVQWCCTVIQAWVVGVDELSRDLNDMYASVISQNDKAVAGRWRALCYGGSSDVSSEARGKLPENVVRALVALPVLCGYISSREIHTDLAKEFEQRIGPLLDKCLKFRKMIGEGITSTDIRPYFVASGQSYDPSIAELEYEDDGDDTGKEKQGIIACSLGMGLYCTRTSRGDDGRFVESREPILKPKVILQETLREIIA